MKELNKHNNLLSELRKIINKGKQKVAVQVNSALTLTYWHVGKRINQDFLQNKRADYGNKLSTHWLNNWFCNMVKVLKFVTFAE